MLSSVCTGATGRSASSSTRTHTAVSRSAKTRSSMARMASMFSVRVAWEAKRGSSDTRSGRPAAAQKFRHCRSL